MWDKQLEVHGDIHTNDSMRLRCRDQPSKLNLNNKAKARPRGIAEIFSETGLRGFRKACFLMGPMPESQKRLGIAEILVQSEGMSLPVELGSVFSVAPTRFLGSPPSPHHAGPRFLVPALVPASPPPLKKRGRPIRRHRARRPGPLVASIRIDSPVISKQRPY